MVDGRRTRFVEMAREFPVRTSLFTVGPLLFALVQLFNSYAFGIPILQAGGFALVVLAFAVQVNRLHLASFHRMTVSRRWLDGE